MRALRILVVVMGIMILGGFAALVAIIAGRLAHPRPAPSPSAAAAPGVALPAGAHIESMAVGTERLAIELLLPDGSRRIDIVDLASGRQLRTIPLRTAP